MPFLTHPSQFILAWDLTDCQWSHNNYKLIIIIIITRNLKVIWEELYHHSSWQEMESPAACASCAVPTADEFSHSAAGTLHPQRSATFSLYVTLHYFIALLRYYIALSPQRLSLPSFHSTPDRLTDQQKLSLHLYNQLRIKIFLLLLSQDSFCNS